MANDSNTVIYQAMRTMANESTKVIYETPRTIASGDNSTAYACFIGETSLLSVVVLLVTIPLQLNLMKVLAKDFQLSLPRHKVLFSLSLSDTALVCGLFIITWVNKAVQITRKSTGCLVYRGFVIFIASLGSVSSALSITALSVERYVACIHCFHLHQIFTESRVRYGSIIGWGLAVLISLFAAFTNDYDDTAILARQSTFHYVYISFIAPSSISTGIIQFRLFLFSKRKINQVLPAGTFGAKLEVAHYRKKQLKVAFMAGIVAFVFIICMLPLAVVLLYELLSGETVSSPKRDICMALSCCNAVADPFIYGFGVADTRQKIFKDLKKLTSSLVNILPTNLCQSSPQANREHLGHRNNNVFTVYQVRLTRTANPKIYPRVQSVEHDNRIVEHIYEL